MIAPCVKLVSFEDLKKQKQKLQKTNPIAKSILAYLRRRLPTFWRCSTIMSSPSSMISSERAGAEVFSRCSTVSRRLTDAGSGLDASPATPHACHTGIRPRARLSAMTAMQAGAGRRGAAERLCGRAPVGLRSPASWARSGVPGGWALQGRRAQLSARWTPAPFGAGAEGEASREAGRSQSPARRVGRKGSGLGRERGTGRQGRNPGRGGGGESGAEIKGEARVPGDGPGRSRMPRSQPRVPAAAPGPPSLRPLPASQSPPRGPGPAATPSSSRPRPRASHSSPHSAHSRLPPFKPEAGGGENPQLPAPPRCCIPQVSGPDAAPLGRRGRSFLPAWDLRAGPAFRPPLPSPFSRFLPSAPPARSVPPAPFLLSC